MRTQKRTRLIIAIIVLLTFTVPSQVNAKATPRRLDGKNRFEIALHAAFQEFEDTHKVILVNSNAWADALSACNLSDGEAPIFYVRSNSIDDDTFQWMAAHPLDEIILIGGEKSISKDVEATLRSQFSDAKIVRYDGRDRYEVSLAIVEAAPKKKTILATGTTYADALVAAPLITSQDANLLIVNPQNLGEEAVTYLCQKNGDLMIVGNTISDETVSAALDAHDASQEITVIGGSDRYEVSANIQKIFFKDPRSVIAASGEVFSDAVIAGPIAQKINAPILLVRKDSASPSVREGLFADSVKGLMVVGGDETIAASEGLFSEFYE
ncbi:MAG: cell wall-binding repeat-containing protein [Peptoniphilaceae bacterium]|nr:cell wall-binding repeat-containing protein [Peptoniphilaceae bacterium]MDY6085573.1 cell wall-binding repeat-containing protein [Peptoniphilaceae bacterium]